MASAQVKSAVLLAGLDAKGETVVREHVPTRTHTEDMLARAGADVTVEWEAGARVVRLRQSKLRAGEVHVPGDPSQAAFWVVAALVAAGSRVTVEGIYLGSERVGYLGVLERMGAHLEVEATGPDEGSVTASTSTLHATDVEAAEIPSLDEVPILAVAAARARGQTRFRDVAELRIKESDRLDRHGQTGQRLWRHGYRRRRRPGGDRSGRGAHGCLHRRRRRPPHGHGCGRGRRLRQRGRFAHPDHRLGVGRHQLPGFLATLDRLRGGEDGGAGAVTTVSPVMASPIIAIDGPAGSGKSTLSRALCERSGPRPAGHRGHVPGR